MEKTFETQAGEITGVLFKLQKEKGIDLSDWSKDSGILKGRIEGFEKGEEIPTLGLLIRLAHALGYNVKLETQSTQEEDHIDEN